MRTLQDSVIVAIGEILWDLFPDGAHFGGAPANYACHSARLGLPTSMVSAVGEDELGNRALAELSRHSIDTSPVAQLAEWPTGRVTVSVSQDGLASYDFGKNEAWDHLQFHPMLKKLAANTGAVCFGTLGQRQMESRRTIQKFIASTPNNCLRILDVNLRAEFFSTELLVQSLELANTVKLNDEEFDEITKRLKCSGPVEDRLEELLNRFGLQLIALTRGAKGSALAIPGRIHELSGIRVEVRDTVGAGDAFTAALTRGMLQGTKLEALHEHAARIAAWVCTQDGGTPLIPDALIFG